MTFNQLEQDIDAAIREREPSLLNWRSALLDPTRREAGLKLLFSIVRQLSDNHMRIALQLITRDEMPSLSLDLRTMCVELLCRLNERAEALRIVLGSRADGDTYLYCTFVRFRGCRSFDEALDFIDSVRPLASLAQGDAAHILNALNALVCDATTFRRLVSVARDRPGWLDGAATVQNLVFSVFCKVAPADQRNCAVFLVDAINRDDETSRWFEGWLAYAFENGEMPVVDKSTEELMLGRKCQSQFAFMLCAMATRGDTNALDNLLSQHVSFGRHEKRGGELDLHGDCWGGDIVLLPLVYKWLHCRKNTCFSQQLRVVVGRGKHSRSSTRRGSLGNAVRRLLQRCELHRGNGDLVVFTKALKLSVTDLVGAIRFAMEERQIDAKSVASP